MGIFSILILVAVGLIVIFLIVVFNNLVMLKHNVAKAWANIDVLLKQRHDELPKLVETCKQYMKFEQETLEKGMLARSRVADARQQQNIGAAGAAEGALRAGPGNLFALAEAYPELKTDETFQHLQARISTLENGIADRREFYNESVNVDADGAEVYTTHKKTWRDGEYRYTEWLLLPDEPLYVIGHFSTIGSGVDPLNRSEEISALLAEWKHKHKELLRRFDLNRDGEIDLGEWGAARQAAQREVEAAQHELALRDGFHMMTKPKDGRFFLISNLAPEKFARRYLIWAWYHLAMIFVSGGLAGRLL